MFLYDTANAGYELSNFRVLFFVMETSEAIKVFENRAYFLRDLGIVSLILCGLMDVLFYLQEYGHRVRLATHANFKDFVLTAGLEFFPLGGDPKVLAGCKCRVCFLTFYFF